MNLAQANGILSIMNIAQTALDYRAMNIQAQQLELQGRWAAVEAKLAESALNEQYLQDSAVFEARAAAMGHHTSNLASSRLAARNNLERDKRMIRLRAEAEAAETGVLVSGAQFQAGVNAGIDSFANIREDLNRRAKLAQLTYAGYHKKESRQQTKLEDN